MLSYEQLPKTGSGSLATARELHSSNVLPNRKVRVTCGSDGDKVLAIASKDGGASWRPAAVTVSAPSGVKLPLTLLAALVLPGRRGLMSCDQMVTSDARQIAITKLGKNSPAADDFKVGYERISAWALVTQYGKPDDIRWLPPMIQKMEVKGGKILLTLVPNEVDRHNDGPILGFTITGKHGKFQPAKAEWGMKDDRSSIVLSSPLVTGPVYYRHAWGRKPLANLKAEGVSLDTLRNDNFYTGKKSAVPGILNEEEVMAVGEALKAEDVKHRLKAAETFIKEYEAQMKAAQE